MAYSSGTIATTSTPALAFMNVLDTALTANGWTFVEQWTSATWTARIYKSTAAANGSVDIYLNVVRTSDSATTVNFGVGESYDISTHKFSGYAYPSQTAPAAGTFLNSGAALLPNASQMTVSGCTISASGFDYWLSVNAKRFYVSARVGASTFGSGAGLFDDLLPANIGLPCIFVGFASPVLTREPYITSGSASTWQGGLLPYTINFTANDIYLGAPMPSRVCLFSSGSGTYVRGLMKDLLYYSNSQSVGDILTVTLADGSTKTYVNFTGSAYHWVDNSA